MLYGKHCRSQFVNKCTLNSCSALLSNSSEGSVVKGFSNGSFECVIIVLFQSMLSETENVSVKECASSSYSSYVFYNIQKGTKY